MFSNSKRAFYKQAASYSLKLIDKQDYVKWIQKLYAKDNRAIDSKYIENIVTRCANHPMYIQEFFFYLWNLSEVSITNTNIDKLELKILKNREAEFMSIWDALTLNQRKALKLIAKTNGKHIFSAENLFRTGFKSASQVKKALEVLEKREIVSKNKHYVIQDILFKLWIEKISYKL